jgi:hypothetical protein
MNKKFSTILTVLLILILSTSSVGAAGAIKLSATITSASPLHVEGILTGGTGNTLGVTVTLTGFGDITSVFCKNPNGKQSPGHNPGRIIVSGAQEIEQSQIDTGGNVVVSFSAQQPDLSNACPNSKWTVTSYSIAWTSATIDITDNALPSGSNLMLHQEYACALQPGSSTAYICTLVSETRYF